MTVRYTSAAAFRQALEAHLRQHAQQSGMSLIRLRKVVTFERLLARLLVVAPDRWMLKGALALDFRLGAQVRATQDMDLGRVDDADAATADLACRVVLRPWQFLHLQQPANDAAGRAPRRGRGALPRARRTRRSDL